MAGRPAGALAAAVESVENDVAWWDNVPDAWRDVTTGMPHAELVRRHGWMYRHAEHEISRGRRAASAAGWPHFTEEAGMRAETFTKIDGGLAVPRPPVRVTEFDPNEPGWAGVLVDIVRLLPRDREWTAEKRQRWLKAIEANVDRVVRVTPVKGERL